MTFWKVLLVLATVVFLLSRVRLGGIAEYKGEVFYLRVLAGPFRIKIFPRPAEKSGRKKEKPKKTEGKSKSDTEKRQSKPKMKLPPIGDLVHLALEVLGQLKRKIRLDDLTLHLTWASEDPAETAIGFGKAQATLGMIWPLIANNFDVKKHDLGVSVDFERTRPDICARGVLTMTVGQLVSFGMRFGIKILVLLNRSRKAPQNQQEERNHERKQPSHQ